MLPVGISVDWSRSLTYNVRLHPRRAGSAHAAMALAGAMPMGLVAWIGLGHPHVQLSRIGRKRVVRMSRLPAAQTPGVEWAVRATY